MMKTTYKLILLLLLLFNVAFGQESKKYLIKAGKLFNSENKTFLKNQFIFIEGEKIVKVADADDLKYPDYETIDLSNSTVIPGLIDSHTHFLFMQESGTNMEVDLIKNSDDDRLLRGGHIAKSFLSAGITTVKDLGNSGQYLDVTLRNAIDQGWVEGSRMLVSGPIISPPNGQFGKLPHLHKNLPAKEYSIVRTVDEAQSAVIEHINNGVDIIKICATNDNGLILSTEQMEAIVEIAHKNNLKVTAHATYDQIIYDAVMAGVDGIEHGYSVSDSTLQLMAEKGVYLVPTDGTFDGYKGIVEFSKSNITDEDIKSFVASTEQRLLKAIQTGVKIVYGSDLYFYTPRSIGIEAKNSLVSYFEAGIPVNEVLQIGTYNGAYAVGKQNEIGVIKPDAFADIVAFEGDLEKDFKDLIYDKNHFVMKAGVVFKKP